MKLKNAGINIVYSFIYELVFVPFFAFFSYYIYDSYAFTNEIHDSKFLLGLLLAVIVILNLIGIYYLVRTFINVYKMQLIYYVVIGLCTTVICMWVKVYYYVLRQTNCVDVSTDKCLLYFNNDKTITTILVFVFTYYLLFIVNYLMISKKKNIKSKKQ